MKQIAFFAAFIFLLLVQSPQVFSQQKIFNQVVSLCTGDIRAITQDKEGFIIQLPIN